MDESLVEFIYDAMQGEYLDTMPRGMVNEFAEGAECYRLYEQVYAAERRLEERLGVDEYDDDVEKIIVALLDMQKILCFKMYEYGARFGYDWDRLYAAPEQEEKTETD